MAGLRAHEGLPDWMDARHSTRAYAPREVPLPLLQNLLVQTLRQSGGARVTG